MGNWNQEKTISGERVVGEMGMKMRAEGKGKIQFLTQNLYCSNLRAKCSIQFPSDFSVSGASRFHMPGICPLNRQRLTSSSSLLIPTSPARACTKYIYVYKYNEAYNLSRVISKSATGYLVSPFSSCKRRNVIP